ncbi:histidine phosphatase family protein [Mariniluteicoccus endophyticus]
MSRLLILMRHAQAADYAPGRGDRERPLTDRGHDQARAVGRFLAQQRVRVDHALVSGALRTRQTAADLALGDVVEHVDGLYNADPDTIRQAISEAPEEARTLLVVAHNPGIHQTVLDLGDLSGHPEAQRLAYSFPTASLVGLAVDAWGAPIGVPAFVRLGA